MKAVDSFSAFLTRVSGSHHGGAGGRRLPGAAVDNCSGESRPQQPYRTPDLTGSYGQKAQVLFAGQLCRHSINIYNLDGSSCGDFPGCPASGVRTPQVRTPSYLCKFSDLKKTHVDIYHTDKGPL